MIWKDIKGYEGLYQVSDEGQVRRLLKDGRTRPVKNRENLYPTVSLSKNGIYKSYNVHRLVAEAFIERPEGTEEVNHKDGNKWNNHVENLEWVTQKQNLIHSIKELNHFPWGKPPKPVRCLDKDTGEVVAEFYSVAEASRALGKANTRGNITQACKGYLDTAYGYRWEYAD